MIREYKLKMTIVSQRNIPEARVHGRCNLKNQTSNQPSYIYSSFPLGGLPRLICYPTIETEGFLCQEYSTRSTEIIPYKQKKILHLFQSSKFSTCFMCLAISLSYIFTWYLLILAKHWRIYDLLCKRERRRVHIRIFKMARTTKSWQNFHLYVALVTKTFLASLYYPVYCSNMT